MERTLCNPRNRRVLIGVDYTEPLSVDFLKENPNLVLDTCHYDSDFKDRLLAHLDDLDNKTDGLLIHGENFQALNLLKEKYRESLKAIYIDPPYNTKGSPILYKNNYKDSSWLTLMTRTYFNFTRIFDLPMAHSVQP